MSSIQTLVEQVNQKRPVFTVTAGRTGTTYVTELFGLMPDTCSVHEPPPDFVRVMRKTRMVPASGHAFCVQTKLPAIAARPESRYVETSHLFCKGFFEQFLKLGVTPDLLILRRAPRAIALSLLSRNTVPARTPMGWKYLLSPADPGVLPLDKWPLLTDYQLCFWYALEIERRQALYQQYMAETGGRWFSTTADALRDYAVFRQMLTAFGFEWDETVDRRLPQRHETVSTTSHNLNARRVHIGKERLERLEQEVWERVSDHDPGLWPRAKSLYGI